MNNTIFTRKFGLGVLIALIMAFGVQTVADAQLRVSSSRGDLQVKPLVANQSFEFSFFISGVPHSRPDVRPTPSDAFEVDDTRESITIIPTNGSITAVRMGGTTYSPLNIESESRFDLEEWHKDGTNGILTKRDDVNPPNGTTEGDLSSGTVTVTVIPGTTDSPTLGPITITVTDGETDDDDTDTAFTQLTFTAYAVRPAATIQSLRFAATTADGAVNPTTKNTYPSTDPNDPLYDEVVAVTIHDVATDTNNSSWALVDFEVVEGPGFVYDDLNNDSQPDTLADRSSKTTRTLTRLGENNDIASVRLRSNGGTNKVRATITNTQPPQTYEITYLYQGTATGTGITTPTQPSGGPRITVNAPATGTVGQAIRVTTTLPNAGSGTLVAFSSTGGSFSSASTPTNSSGVAEIQFTPNTTGAITITATATGYTNGTDTVQVASGLSTLRVLTPRPITANPGATLNIVVQAETSGVLVVLSGTGFTTVSSPTASNRQATIPVVMPTTAGTYLLRATATGYDSQSISVIVSGSATTNIPVQLTIPSGQTQTVPIQSSAALRVRVTRIGTNAVQSGVSVTFRNASGTTIHTANTGSNGEVTYNFPVTILGSHTVSATLLAANNANFDVSGVTPVTFTITGSRQQPTQSARITILQPTDGSGQTLTETGPGATYPLTILMTTANGAAAVNQVITLTVENAVPTVISSTTLITGANGRATTQDTFRLPTTPGVYTIKATSGTEFREITVTVVTIRLVKDASDNVSGDNQEGDRGEVLDDPFLIKVVRDVANVETAVQGVPVTFTVVDGDGELSTSSGATSGSNSVTVNSDTNGEVRAYLVLGEDDEDNRVRASIGDSTVTNVFFDATGELVPDDIEIVSGNNQHVTPNRYTDPMVVHVTDENGDDLQGVDVTFSLRGPSGTLTPRTATTDRNGEAEAELLPRSTGTYFVEARVTGVTSVRFTITVGDLADSIEIVSGDNQSGDPGTELDDPLVVEVLDDDDDPVSGVTVTFSITAGDGTLSDTSVTTNSRGRAQTELTLGDEPGRNTVRASVSGVSDRATFTATAVDPAPPEPDVRLPVAQRADTYWINTENGTIHSLVGNSVEDVAPNVQDVVSLVATDNRLYWVEKTSNNSGRIRRANLNGNNIQLIRSLTTAPAGITIDTVNAKIYITTERGKVQSINVDGSDYEPNVIVGLDTPADIAVDAGSGKIFWITESGTVHYANVDGSGETQFASGYDTLHSITVGAAKVYWTEETTDSAGKIHSADLDGSNVTEIVESVAIVYGISVDAANKDLYWTNSRGKIIQSNLNGKSREPVVTDLVSLGGISVPAGTAPTRPPGTFSKYDVNKDGVVDNVDAALVADALGQTNPDNARLDVNDDGNVNFLDLLLVFDNRDDTGAAPVTVAKLPKVSPEEIQKQIDLLIASNKDSLTAQYTLTYLQSLLEVVSPERTRLLANYPNPFNPETWIPYQLAKSSQVQITIYNTAGNVVRTLNLGHQSEGYYTDRSRAAYWDGRNVIGEQVASGVYFYVFTANEFSATRKMLILK